MIVSLKDFLRTCLQMVSRWGGIASHRLSFLRTADILIDDYIARHLHGNPKYGDPKRLNRHEFQIFSQAGEDGILSRYSSALA